MTVRYLLDTGIVSNPISRRPDPAILKRLEAHGPECAIAAPVWHELTYGYRRLPRGRRRSAIEAYLRDVIRGSFPNLAYDEAAATWHGEERARLESLGQTPPFVDGQIAAIARAHGLTVVTTNDKDFGGFQGARREELVEGIKPFKSAAEQSVVAGRLGACAVLDSPPPVPGRTIGRMADMTLYQFLNVHRGELINRCKAKVAARSAPPLTEAAIDHGVPLFLNQLSDEFRRGPSKTHEISTGAMKHGHDLLVQGFNISQVVHGYGDVCQSITDLAVEMNAPISTEDFRTLNRCLDDAIAGAVTEFARVQDVSRDGESHELRDLLTTAIAAFEVLQSGNVGVSGSTGAVVLRSLRAMDALVKRQSAPIAPTATEANGR